MTASFAHLRILLALSLLSPSPSLRYPSLHPVRLVLCHLSHTPVQLALLFFPCNLLPPLIHISYTLLSFYAPARQQYLGYFQSIFLNLLYTSLVPRTLLSLLTYLPHTFIIWIPDLTFSLMQPNLHARTLHTLQPVLLITALYNPLYDHVHDYSCIKDLLHFLHL
ncbi:hypothetical protein FA15DRAFT_672794 [Coprinopsis marcescibilis]|uniref:Uncharacterized protein n=1 Tax=Coprinopsis marcescibilis TaxID=230819 RepID=A0A5C3KLJ9_COPMA|nr:hypothetical protein FA15DRAFT_672794 [Coprinopsis marcescibilis]